ncbi:MAG: hypothetical protein BWX93_00932 [Bacteroidetes bacterium ADurb.Bin139]|nr:MAG: hypothetical protein BWX93_00932 [Bacteroidetes bacterium ADurb.Bin139]
MDFAEVITWLSLIISILTAILGVLQLFIPSTN